MLLWVQGGQGQGAGVHMGCAAVIPALTSQFAPLTLPLTSSQHPPPPKHTPQSASPGDSAPIMRYDVASVSNTTATASPAPGGAGPGVASSPAATLPAGLEPRGVPPSCERDGRNPQISMIGVGGAQGGVACRRGGVHGCGYGGGRGGRGGAHTFGAPAGDAGGPAALPASSAARRVAKPRRTATSRARQT
jgi:hypothetical protein